MIDAEFVGAREDLVDLMNTSFMGSSTNGLEVSIDSTTTYAGIARGSAAYWESSETAHSAVLSRTGLLNIHETARDNDKGAHTTLILLPHNQATNYVALTGEPNAQNSSLRVELGLVGGGAMDLAPSVRNLSFMGIPIVPLPDFTNTVILGLDTNPIRVGPKFGLSVRRDFDVRGPQMSGDDDVYEVSTAATLINHLPRTDWKLTGVTA